jgi:hypothetical protein
VTRQSPPVGAVLLGYICGVFLMQDNDNKFVAVDDEIRLSMTKVDIESLDEVFYHGLLRLLTFPRFCGQG